MSPEPAHPATTDDPLVCFCMRVRQSTLVEAIARGAHTLEALQAATRAGMGCGTCRIDLLALLEAADAAAKGRN